jgi:hypothetical protein
MDQQRITHVALRIGGTVYALPAPNRHHHVIRWLVDEKGFATVEAHGDDQGFVDSLGNYLTRAQAYRVAQAAGQLRPDRPNWNDELYSENLW